MVLTAKKANEGTYPILLFSLNLLNPLYPSFPLFICNSSPMLIFLLEAKARAAALVREAEAKAQRAREILASGSNSGGGSSQQGGSSSHSGGQSSGGRR
jgi:uncharacterized membrane protein YgcG